MMSRIYFLNIYNLIRIQQLHNYTTAKITKNHTTRRMEVHINPVAIKHIIINLNIKKLTNINLRLHLQRKDVFMFFYIHLKN